MFSNYLYSQIPQNQYSKRLQSYFEALYHNNFNLVDGMFAYHIYPQDCHEFISIETSTDPKNTSFIANYKLIHRQSQSDILNVKLKQISDQIHGSFYYRHDLGTYLYMKELDTFKDYKMDLQSSFYHKNSWCPIIGLLKSKKDSLTLNAGIALYNMNHLCTLKLCCPTIENVTISDTYPSIHYEYSSSLYHFHIGCPNLLQHHEFYSEIRSIHPKYDLLVRGRVQKEKGTIQFILNKENPSTNPSFQCGLNIDITTSFDLFNPFIYFNLQIPSQEHYKYNILLNYGEKTGFGLGLGFETYQNISTLQKTQNKGILKLSFLNKIILSFGYQYQFSHFDKEY